MRLGKMNFSLDGVNVTFRLGGEECTITVEELESLTRLVSKNLDLRSRRHALLNQLDSIEADLEGIFEPYSRPISPSHLALTPSDGWKHVDYPNKWTDVVRVEWKAGHCCVSGVSGQQKGLNRVDVWEPSVWRKRETSLFPELPEGLRAAVFEMIEPAQRGLLHHAYLAFTPDGWALVSKPEKWEATVIVHWGKGHCTVENKSGPDMFKDCYDHWAPTVWEHGKHELLLGLPRDLRVAVLDTIRQEQE